MSLSFEWPTRFGFSTHRDGLMLGYQSTRGASEPKTFRETVVEGAAPDGGLYVPHGDIVYEHPPSGSEHGEYVTAALEAFGAVQVGDLVEKAMSRFHHKEIAPIREVGPFQVLELFWGPTLSFKDHALQVLGQLFNRYLAELNQTRMVLVATSGDTGSAAIEAFRGLDAVRLVVLYPAGMVSDFQRRQMTTVADDNVAVVSVAGTFDECQRLVKEAFGSLSGLASANSINWGRIAAQVGYYMSASARSPGDVEVVVPTGNFGNAYSARQAKSLGASFSSITIATNANRVLHDLAETGQLDASGTIPTLAPAMDIQVPSNLERYLHERDPSSFGSDFGSGWADDAKIEKTIRNVYETFGYILDPHTAAAWSVAESVEFATASRLIVATAHPAKFANTIENATGVTPEVPRWAVIDPELEERHVEIGPSLDDLRNVLDT